eukprot:PhM_4_TR1420/c0_g1_i1/m.66686
MMSLRLIALLGFFVAVCLANDQPTLETVEHVDEDGNRNTITINPDNGEMHISGDHLVEDARKPIKSEHPALCENIVNKYTPVILAKATAMQEIKFFQAAADLAQELEAKQQQYEKQHHEFECHEAKAVLDSTHAREFMRAFGTILEVPTKGHTGEQLIALLGEAQRELNAAKLLSDDSSAEFTDVMGDLRALRDQYGRTKPDYQDVLEEKGNCKEAFQRLVKDLMQISHDHIPNWEILEFGMDSLQSQCLREEEL